MEGRNCSEPGKNYFWAPSVAKTVPKCFLRGAKFTRKDDADGGYRVRDGIGFAERLRFAISIRVDTLVR
jgi:hypothetical protein